MIDKDPLNEKTAESQPPEKDEESQAPSGPVEPGNISFTFTATPEELGDWDITFRWEEEMNPYATFTLWFAPGQNMGGDLPIDGWVSWIGQDLLLVTYDWNDPSHDAIHLHDAGPLREGEDEKALRDPQRWLNLARRIVRAYMRVDD